MKSNWPIFENWVWTWLFISLPILKVPTTSKPAGHNTYICRENYLQHPQEIYRTTANISVRLTNLYDNPEPSDTQNVLRINVVRIFHSHIETHGIGTRIHFIIQKHQPEQEFVQEPGCGIRFVVSMSFDGLFCWVGTYYLLFAIYCRWGEGNWALPCYFLYRCSCSGLLLLGIYIIMSLVLCYTRARQLVPYVANGLDSDLFIFQTAAEALRAKSNLSNPIVGHL